MSNSFDYIFGKAAISYCSTKKLNKNLIFFKLFYGMKLKNKIINYKYILYLRSV